MTDAPRKGRTGKGSAAKSAAKPVASKARGRKSPASKVSKPRAKPSAPRARVTKPVAGPVTAPPTREAPESKSPIATPIAKPTTAASGAPVLDVVNMKKKKVGQVELTQWFFVTPVNQALIHEAVVMQLASQRQGTADTKERGEVRGSGRKPWKQKGSGRARAGSVRSPIWRGGGTVFGPTPRSYAYAFPRKKARAALAGAMSAKVAQGDVTVLDELSLTQPKTKEMAGILKSLGLDGRVLIVHRDETGSLRRASANLGRVTVLDVARLNLYDVLSHRHIVLMQSDLPRFGEVWS
jgi:large subunit ribosomal protein L4